MAGLPLKLALLLAVGWLGVAKGRNHYDELRGRRQACETSTTTINGGKVACKDQLLFEENFDGPTLDTRRWKADFQLAQEPDFQFSVLTDEPKNLFVRGGALFLKPSLVSSKDDFLVSGTFDFTDAGCTGRTSVECKQTATAYNILPPVFSARVRSRDLFSFRYGVLEARLKMPDGNWLFPEAFLEPVNASEAKGPGAYPRMVLGFCRGNAQLVTADGHELGAKRLYSGIMRGTEEPTLAQGLRAKDAGGEGAVWNDVYHVYRVTWTPDGITITVDGQPLADLKPPVGQTRRTSPWTSGGSKMAPFDSEFYITFGLGVGGVRAFPDGSVSNGQPKPWKNTSAKAKLDFILNKVSWRDTWAWDDSALQVDYVKVWAL